MPVTLGNTSITSSTGDLELSGDVGIGTSSPSYKLDVSASVASNFVARVINKSGSNSTDNALLVETSTASSARIISARNAGTECFAVSGDGTVRFDSGYGSAATAYGCRAWVNFNGTGTVAIRASGNVSSITDNGPGDYTVNFTSAMPDANYAVSGFANSLSNSTGDQVGLLTSYATLSPPTASAFRFTVANSWNGDVYDASQISIAIFR